MKVQIRKSTDPKKKLMAIFTENGKKVKTTHFGSRGMDDFTKTKDEAQKKRYLDRHRKRENWSAPKTAGALSRWILWNKPTRAASIADFKRRFNLQ
tara:strand:- start:850 stop:1137 length:288 start_codon:yes stop_codon:yes gene_type:complete